MDSASPVHLTHDASELKDVKPYDGVVRWGGTGSQDKIMGVGTLSWNSPTFGPVQVKNVFLVPGSRVKIISGTLLSEQGCRTTYLPNGGDAEVFMNEKKILTGQFLGNGHWAMRGKPVMVAAPAAATSSSRDGGNQSSSSQAQLWHRRLGHVSYGTMVRALKGNMVKGMDATARAVQQQEKELCEPCVLAKQTRLPFPNSGSREKQPLSCLHADLCGPIQEGDESDRYMLTMVDDHSRYSVVRILSSKADTAGSIKEVVRAAT